MASSAAACLAVLLFALSLLSGAHGAAVDRRAASPGCGTQHRFVGESREFSFRTGGRLRHYRIHLPSNYKAKTPQPLLIAYHGSGNNPERFEEQTRLSDESVNPGMVTVYPAGVKGDWQGPTYATPGVDDLAFTTDLVKRIKDRYCVDESRVYATGHSNGGGFVGTLACSHQHGGQFAAFAPISGAFYTDVDGDVTCNPSRSPLPMLEVHGTDDHTIPYGGGEGRGGPLPAIDNWLCRWAHRNGCTSHRTTDLAQNVHDTKWTCAATDDGLRDGLRHIKIVGHNHTWPGPRSEIDISPVVVSFLSGHGEPTSTC